MTNYKIVVDGSCDLDQETIKKYGLDVVPFYVKFKTDEFLKEGVELDYKKFYQDLVDNPGVFPNSSMPSVLDYEEVFEKYARENISVICLCLTKKFSGSYTSAMNAKTHVLEKFPNVKIEVIDSTLITGALGLLVEEALRLQSEGTSFDELVEKINQTKETGKIFFTTKNLSYLQHGGRIGKVASIIGNWLKISPIITFKEGEIFSSGIAVTRNRSLLKVKETLVHYLNDINANKDDYLIRVGYAYDEEEGKMFLETIKKLLPGYNITTCHIGATICVHTGPHPIGVCILKKMA